MSTVKFICHSIKKRKDGRHPIVLRITSGNNRKYIFTGFNCYKDEWDVETETVMNNYSAKIPSRTQINAYLIKQKAEVQEIHEQFVKDGIRDYTPDQFIKIYSKTQKAKTTVFNAFLNRIDELKRSGRIGNSDAYRTSYLAFKSWKKTDLQLRDLTPEILEKWTDHLKVKDVKDTSISFYMRTLRALYRYAINKKWVREEYYPFHEFKVSEFSTETSPRALDNDKLEKLLRNDVDPYLQLAKDIFVFSFFGRGISFIDISLLTAKNLQDGHIIYERKKMAKRPVRVAFPIRTEIQDILDRYHNTESGYLLPILDVNKHKTEQQKLDRIKKMRKKVNRDLKILGKQIEVEGLTTYWARHSYASFMFRKGMTPMMIKESLRHKNLKTTELYIKSLGLDAISDFEDQAFNNN
jgi:site-specific recombinase XerD